MTPRLKLRNIAPGLVVFFLTLLPPPGPAALAESWRWSLKNTGAATVMNAVHGAAWNDLWVAGNGALTMRFNGSTWTPVPFPVSTDVMGIFALDAAHVWASTAEPWGDFNHVAVFFFDGSSWTQQPRLQNCYAISCVCASSPTQVWAGASVGGGYEAGVLYWTGTAWGDLALPAGNGGVTFAVDSIGETVRAGTRGGQVLYRTGSVGGWVTIKAGGPPILGLSVLTPDDIWASGYDFGGAWHGYIHHYNGSAWQTWEYDKTVVGVYAVSSASVWAAGQAGILHFDGTGWSVSSAWDGGGRVWADESHVFVIQFAGGGGAYMYGERAVPTVSAKISKTSAGAKLTCTVKQDGKPVRGQPVWAEKAAASSGPYSPWKLKNTNKKGKAGFKLSKPSTVYYIRCNAGGALSPSRKVKK